MRGKREWGEEEEEAKDEGGPNEGKGRMNEAKREVA